MSETSPVPSSAVSWLAFASINLALVVAGSLELPLIVGCFVSAAVLFRCVRALAGIRAPA